MHELAQLFPWEKSLATYQTILRRFRESGCINHFNLIPYPNERLLYNPIYVLLGAGILNQLLYLALALHDTKNAIGRTKAFTDITFETEENYRGALFEIEVCAEL